MLGKLISFHIDLVNLEPIILTWLRSSSGKMFMQAVSVATDTVLTSRLKRGPGKEMKKARDSQLYGGYLLQAAEVRLYVCWVWRTPELKEACSRPRRTQPPKCRPERECEGWGSFLLHLIVEVHAFTCTQAGSSASVEPVGNGVT